MANLRIKPGVAQVDDRPRGEPITLAEWREGVRPEAGRFELVVPNTEDLTALADVVRRFDAVALEFPTFKDGRAYSQARVLRERLGFAGDIIAEGAVLCDQALFMARAGFNVIEIGEGDAAGFARALGAYSAFYQPAADAAPSIHNLRATRRAAA